MVFRPKRLYIRKHWKRPKKKKMRMIVYRKPLVVYRILRFLSFNETRKRPRL